MVDGRVTDGGLQLAVLDNRAGGTVGLSFYWWGEPYARNSRMAVAFELAKPTEVSFIFANFSLLGDRSLWSIRSATVIRQPGGCRLGSPHAWFTNAPPEPSS